MASNQVPPETTLAETAADRALRERLLRQVASLPAKQLPQLADHLDRTASRTMPRETQSVGTSTGPGNAGEFPWPHAPTHRLSEFGTYIITGSTYNKQHHFRGFDRLEYLTKTLLTGLRDSGWHVEAWAVFSNHYHFVAHAGHNCDKLGLFLKRLHGETAIEINARDAKPKRMVWFNFWDTQLTYENSYLARLHYVHQNPVRHGLVSVANQYRWCSAGWFERTARPAQVKTIYSFGLDRVKVRDDFEPVI